tara:strand:- start:237 stop:494 length:258 start_codon:yes stop_codon:yes gene_type:complete
MNVHNLDAIVLQMLTTCGGWQDQVGGAYPGFKVTASVPHTIPGYSYSIISFIFYRFEEKEFICLLKLTPGQDGMIRIDTRIVVIF